MKTQADHNAASAKKGFLQASQVLKIKEALMNGENPRALAVIYGVSPLTITRIRSGETWAWLKPYGNAEMPQAPVPDEVAASLATLQKLMAAEQGGGGLETLQTKSEEELKAAQMLFELTGRKI